MTNTGENAEEATRRISASPGMRAKAIEVASDLAQRAKAAGDTKVMAVLVEHAPTYGLGNKSSGEYGALFKVYLRSLEPLPLEAIRAAFVDWTRDGTGFFPRPEEIFKRAQPHAEKLWMAAYRARKAVEKAERRPMQKTAEEKARDRQAAIDAGVIDANGNVILNFKSDPNARRVGGGETRQEMAARLRRLAEGESIGEAI